MVVTYTPRRAVKPTSDLNDLHVASWNCTTSATDAKLDRIAELVWGPPSHEALHDLVLIQEASRPHSPGTATPYNDFLNALTRNGWEWWLSPDEGPKHSSKNAYLMVWNPLVLRLTDGPVFDVDYAWEPVLEQKTKTRTIRPPVRLNPMFAMDNPPLTARFDNVLTRKPIRVYSWHVTPDGAADRVARWPSATALAAPGASKVAVAKLAGLRNQPQVTQELQEAARGRIAWLLAGDLNTGPDSLTRSVFSKTLPPFPPSLGFSIVTGGGGQTKLRRIDHIIAMCGKKRVPMDKESGLGGKLGDHAPVGAVITF